LNVGRGELIVEKSAVVEEKLWVAVTGCADQMDSDIKREREREKRKEQSSK